MIISRGSILLKTALTELKQVAPNVSRSSHDWYYRVASKPPSRGRILGAQVIGGFMWWWILWHLWHEPEHITGEFGSFPDPSLWTNEELGIPPDDDELGLAASD